MFIYTDGSFTRSTGTAGIGIFFGDNDKRNISMELDKSIYRITSPVSELVAAIKALEIIENMESVPTNITIVSDNIYVVKSMTIWIKKWRNNGWFGSKGKIANLELIQNLDKLTTKYNVNFEHVKAHKKCPNSDKTSMEYKHWYGNQEADKLATLCH